MLHNPYLPKRKKREPIRPTKPPVGAAREPVEEKPAPAVEPAPPPQPEPRPSESGSPRRTNPRQRATELLGPAPTNEPTEPEGAPAEDVSTEPDPTLIDAKYDRPADEFAVKSIDGDYETPAKALPFRAVRRGLDLHCYTGRRFTKKQFDTDGDIIFFNQQEILASALRFIRSHGAAGIKLGSARDKDLPDPDSLEAWLRLHAFALQGRLASYFPPILERLGAITLVTKQRALYAVATGRIAPDDVAADRDADEPGDAERLGDAKPVAGAADKSNSEPAEGDA